MIRWPQAWTHWPDTRRELVVFVPLIAILAALGFVVTIGIGNLILDLVP